MQRRNLLFASCAPLLLTFAAGACAGHGETAVTANKAVAEHGLPARCQSLAANLAASVPADSPVSGLVVTKSRWVEAGTRVPTREGQSAPLPAHCLVEGHFAEHQGLIGGSYAIGFRMRLPEAWNRRFFFQGGGGSDGVVGDATGPNGSGNELALSRGYAVIAQDSGHDNATNTLPSHQNELVFGFDPEARRNYGHASLPQTNALGHFLLHAFYGQDSATNIFWGCSKGGQEGMAFAQRYPDAFDGIVAMAPGMSLPRAALAEAWNTQSLAAILKARGQKPTIAALKTAFTQDQLALVADSTLAACDALDGVADGVIAAVGQCTTKRVLPELKKRECRPGTSKTCLEPVQIEALVRMMRGPHDSSGKPLYAAFPWDRGMTAPGWSMWETGLENGPPSLNVVLGGGSLAAVFTTPPTALGADPENRLAWQLAFDFDSDARKIYAVKPPFTTSAWQDVGMRSTDLSAFRAHGGKLIVPQGASDPVFSVLDTIGWWRKLNKESGGTAASFARVFPVPGMNHCGGGPATSHFDSLSVLERWVVEDKAPDAIPAHAGDDTPFPGRSMPLCAYPAIATGSKKDGVIRYRCTIPAPH
ncbi:tannase/feruloyl esterase family alpha/beta hydrolase [Novosphingobium beihaiensis]|uniref:Tannase/feruloyl esterase family alpha/beta hydrolase n=1 Tax=Novosphingobium beihaiensis TaxID=2930389 RepID=A0ABT0BVN8_9SPHN|nr:tannase/feruloyl esterase family alpha/beta hydrolase [Novosphingobium beihaiensis]MCJ2189107.1 tannase/feruloyl esterase family alpha/beta hydrolase [Novosphingobium beihaiensis]